jgi:hypothetical protein
MVSTNRKLQLPRQRILPSNPLITPSVSSYFSEDEEDKYVDNNIQLQYKVLGCIKYTQTVCLFHLYISPILVV